MLTNFNNSFTAALSDILRKSWNKNYHLTSNVLLHCLAKISATLRHVIQCTCDAKSFIYGICLPEMLLSHISKQINLQHVLNSSGLRTDEFFELCRQSSWASCKLCSHRWRRRDSTRQMSRVGVNWAQSVSLLMTIHAPRCLAGDECGRQMN